MPAPRQAVGIGVPQPGSAFPCRDQLGLPGAGHADPGAGAGRLAGAAVLQDGRQLVLDPGHPRHAAGPRQERRRLSPRPPPGLQYASGRRQSAASQSASRSTARSRMRGEGGISGLGGCKIGSLRGLGRAGNAGPRSP